MALTRAPSRSLLWVWAKVALCLVALDVLLFPLGGLWRLAPTLSGADPTTWGLVYQAAREIEVPQPDPSAFVVGSSVLFLGVNPTLLDATLRQESVPTRMHLLSTFGSSAIDSALMAWQALRRRPWLVVYAAAARDFDRERPTDSPVSRIFDDASVDVPALAPADVGTALDRWVKRAWRLYRYRYFVRKDLIAAASALVPAVRQAAAEEAAAALPPEALERFHFNRITPGSYAAWEKWRQSRRFDDYVGWLHASHSQALVQYATETLERYGPEGNPQAASFDWLLGRLRDRHTRAVVMYFPENPAFRAPGGERYFDPALSQAYADLFARSAAAHGARFVDLRDALDAEDFYDLIHPNLAGMRKLTARMAAVVAEEWRAAQ